MSGLDNIEAIIASLEAETARVRDDGLVSLVDSLHGMCNTLASALGHLVAASEERTISEDVIETARAALLTWSKADGVLTETRRAIREAAPR